MNEGDRLLCGGVEIHATLFYAASLPYNLCTLKRHPKLLGLATISTFRSPNKVYQLVDMTVGPTISLELGHIFAGSPKE